ncbi:hypothetical protein AXF42_Ash017542 [Apostasia shenzhenica]|uniref:Uncharacterized protein n=1 Tax=Apostasia shenzhenica TaxID=1088818 RepID=A0A2I0A3B0_9ASPA|nr:hypothetical protein AXF42_Ash017542 [Apostasia shenzhenica]
MLRELIIEKSCGRPKMKYCGRLTKESCKGPLRKSRGTPKKSQKSKRPQSTLRESGSDSTEGNPMMIEKHC